jgi:DICT domain-containing protein
MLAKARRKAREPLTRPDGSNPGAFYRQVAEAYRDVVQDHRNVAVVLAKEADVPVGTVHRWIMEARRRGFLPAARVGRAG